jgi:DNA mismatch endonuclease, patch repair protein
MIMTDNLTREQRSRTMSRIRARGNRQTELELANCFRRASIRGWRRHLNLPGRPDFSFPKDRLAIFVDGCFWHSCPRHSNMPATNREYWENKLAANKARDRLVNCMLRERGWRVVRIWEHELQEHPLKCVAKIQSALLHHSEAD